MVIKLKHAAVVLLGAGLFMAGCGDDDDNGGDDTADAGEDDSADDSDDDTGGDDDPMTDDDDPMADDDPMMDDDMPDAGDDEMDADGGIEGDAGTAADGGLDTDAGAAMALSLCGGKSGQDQIDCGEYLVTVVSDCVGCHGDDLSGKTVYPPIQSYVPNITQDEATGIGGWTDKQIKAAFHEGIRNDGEALKPVMPYAIYSNMADADADAIVAYLKTVPAVSNAITADDVGRPAQPVPSFDLTNLPELQLMAGDANYEEAKLGQYIVGQVGPCVDCHSPQTAMGPDRTQALLGGAVFGPPGQDPATTTFAVSANLTPHAHGLMGWTAAQVRTVLKEGTDEEGQMICAPPMPSGPMGPFGDLTDEDALAIGHYLVNLEAIANPTGEPYSTMCRMAGADAGTQ